MKDAEIRVKFCELRAAGKSYATLTKELGVSEMTCCRWAKDRKAEVEELRRIQNDALRERLLLAESAKLERLRGVFDRMETAIANLDFQTIPPEKLLKWYMDIMDKLNESACKPEPLSALERSCIELDKTFESM